MLLVSVALALPPAVCPPGLFPASDGRCTGSETPWQAPESLPGRVYLLPDGRVALIEARRVAEGRVVPDAGFLVDPTDGAVRPVPLAFQGTLADRVVQLGSGEILAFRGPSPATGDAPTGEAGEVGVRRLVGTVWVEAGAPPPGPVLGAGVLLEPAGTLLFVGAGDGKATWRRGADGRWKELPALPKARFWPVVFPGVSGPVVCAGVTAAARDADVVPGCLALVGGRWKPHDPGLGLGPEAYGIPVAGGVVVLDPGVPTETADPSPTRGWWVSEGGAVAPREVPPVVRWTVGADLLTGLDDVGRRQTWDPRRGTLATAPAPGAAEAWAGVVIALDADRALFVGAVDTRHAMGVVDSAHPTLSPLRPGMYADGAANDHGVLLLDDTHVGRWDAGSRRFVSLPDLPEARSAAALVAFPDGRVLLAGGRRRDDPSERAWLFEHGAWRAVAPLPSPLTDATGVLLPDGSVVVTGVAPAGPASYRYDLARNTWSALRIGDGAGRLLALPRGAAWVRHEPYGRDAPVSVQVLDGGGWRPVDPVPDVNAAVAITGLADGSLVAAGGRIGDDYGGTTAAWRLPPGASRWEPLPPLTRERWGGTLVELEPGRLLLLGGEGPCELFDGRAWIQAAPLSRDRRHPFAYALDPTTVLVFGGYTEGDGAARTRPAPRPKTSMTATRT